MIYIVTGYMRSGTSMMMQALIAGGLDAAYDARREHMNATYGDDYYQPNTGGFYELSTLDYKKDNFPLDYEGKLIKCLRGALWKIKPHEYKIVFMLRNPEEIRQSYEAFFTNRADGFILDQYQDRMQKSIDDMRDREDVDLTVFQYREVVEDPVSHFEQLKTAGWPIDPIKAAEVVDPSLCRFRIENLVVGL